VGGGEQEALGLDRFQLSKRSSLSRFCDPHLERTVTIFCFECTLLLVQSWSHTGVAIEQKPLLSFATQHCVTHTPLRSRPSSTRRSAWVSQDAATNVS
jgi:hypothetical protein